MHIGLLTLSLHLEGCTSLKEKRQRVGGLRDRFGKSAHIAVCESGDADLHDKAQWSFICAGQQKSFVEGALADIERRIATETDSVIYQRELQFL